MKIQYVIAGLVGSFAYMFYHVLFNDVSFPLSKFSTWLFFLSFFVAVICLGMIFKASVEKNNVPSDEDNSELNTSDSQIIPMVNHE